MVTAIHDMMRTLRDDIKNNRVPLEQYVISKQLSKHPSEYNEKNAQAHVAVALQLISQGKVVRSGDTVPYVICEGPQSQVSQRSHHPTAVAKGGGSLTVDVNWYLANQILPPIQRLVGPIEETSAAQLAECLGLDPTKFHAVDRAQDGMAMQDEEETLLAGQDDEELFRSVDKLSLPCPSCKAVAEFPGVFDLANLPEAKAEQKGPLVPRNGLTCPVSPTTCPGFLPASSSITEADVQRASAYLINYVSHAARERVNRYYQARMRCDRPGCHLSEHGTRNIHLASKVNQPDRPRCFADHEKCSGSHVREYSDAALLLQQRYYKALFDVERFETRLSAESKRRTGLPQPLPPLSGSIPPAHERVFDLVKSYIEHKILRQNDRYVVSMSSCFPG